MSGEQDKKKRKRLDKEAVNKFYEVIKKKWYKFYSEAGSYRNETITIFGVLLFMVFIWFYVTLQQQLMKEYGQNVENQNNVQKGNEDFREEVGVLPLRYNEEGGMIQNMFTISPSEVAERDRKANQFAYKILKKYETNSFIAYVNVVSPSPGYAYAFQVTSRFDNQPVARGKVFIPISAYFIAFDKFTDVRKTISGPLISMIYEGDKVPEYGDIDIRNRYVMKILDTSYETGFGTSSTYDVVITKDGLGNVTIVSSSHPDLNFTAFVAYSKEEPFTNSDRIDNILLSQPGNCTYQRNETSNLDDVVFLSQNSNYVNYLQKSMVDVGFREIDVFQTDDESFIAGSQFRYSCQPTTTLFTNNSVALPFEFFLNLKNGETIFGGETEVRRYVQSITLENKQRAISPGDYNFDAVETKLVTIRLIPIPDDLGASVIFEWDVSREIPGNSGWIYYYSNKPTETNSLTIDSTIQLNLVKNPPTGDSADFNPTTVKELNSVGFKPLYFNFFDLKFGNATYDPSFRTETGHQATALPWDKFSPYAYNSNAERKSSFWLIGSLAIILYIRLISFLGWRDIISPNAARSMAIYSTLFLGFFILALAFIVLVKTFVVDLFLSKFFYQICLGVFAFYLLTQLTVNYSVCYKETISPTSVTSYIVTGFLMIYLAVYRQDFDSDLNIYSVRLMNAAVILIAFFCLLIGLESIKQAKAAILKSQEHPKFAVNEFVKLPSFMFAMLVLASLIFIWFYLATFSRTANCAYITQRLRQLNSINDEAKIQFDTVLISWCESEIDKMKSLQTKNVCLLSASNEYISTSQSMGSVSMISLFLSVIFVIYVFSGYMTNSQRKFSPTKVVQIPAKYDTANRISEKRTTWINFPIGRTIMVVVAGFVVLYGCLGKGIWTYYENGPSHTGPGINKFYFLEKTVKCSGLDESFQNFFFEEEPNLWDASMVLEDIQNRSSSYRCENGTSNMILILIGILITFVVLLTTLPVIISFAVKPSTVTPVLLAIAMTLETICIFAAYSNPELFRFADISYMFNNFERFFSFVFNQDETFHFVPKEN